MTDKVRAGEEVDACPVCEGSEVYIRKDFDPKLGLAVIITGAPRQRRLLLVRDGPGGLQRALGGAALLDLVVYRRLRDLEVCYRCHTEFRGDHKRTGDIFDLHTADVLELEWARRMGKR